MARPSEIVVLVLVVEWRVCCVVVVVSVAVVVVVLFVVGDVETDGSEFGAKGVAVGRVEAERARARRHEVDDRRPVPGGLHLLTSIRIGVSFSERN